MWKASPILQALGACIREHAGAKSLLLTVFGRNDSSVSSVLCQFRFFNKSLRTMEIQWVPQQA